MIFWKKTEFTSFPPSLQNTKKWVLRRRWHLRTFAPWFKNKEKKNEVSIFLDCYVHVCSRQSPSRRLPRAYIYNIVCFPPSRRLPLASPWHKRAGFGGTARKVYLCTGRRRKSAGFSSFRVLRGKLSYMSAKTILYDRKNYKQARKNLLLDSFS